MELWKTIWS